MLSFPPIFSYLNVDEVPLLAIIECKFVFLGCKSLVVVKQSLNLVYTIKQGNFLDENAIFDRKNLKFL